MIASERVVTHLNQSLHRLFERHPSVSLIGEDILDPYGGAFKVAKGLSTSFPDRVFTTPLSEEGIVGLAGGLALCGESPIVEIMFGDFIALAFDPITNFAAKSVTMYGSKVPINLVVRCPVGGSRGYGPTHSQSLQKHFIGVPSLDLYEVSPFHDAYKIFENLIQLGRPSILFEDKVLYTQLMFKDGQVDDIFSYENVGGANDFVRVFSSDFEESEVLIIGAGGVSHRCMAAMRELFIEEEIESELWVPSRLYPLELGQIGGRLSKVSHVFVVEEGGAGGTWGAEISHRLCTDFWTELKNPVGLIQSKDSIIPSSMHLEKEVIVQSEDIVETIKNRVCGHA